MLEQFREWWFSAEQDEMRISVAEGWAFKIWVASRDMGDIYGFDPACAGAEATVITKYSTPHAWKMVPVFPTDAMQVAAANAIQLDTTPVNKLWIGKRVYSAMLAESPTPESE